MNLNINNWTNSDYEKFLKYLDDNSEIEYQKFHWKLVKTGSKVRGIRTPLLRKIAKEISKGNADSFLKLVKPNSYEERIIYGLVITNKNEKLEDLIDNIDRFTEMIDNWAICDLVASSLKQIKKEPDLGLVLINKYLKNNNPWIIRFGLVLLLSHYVNKEYVNTCLNYSNEVTSDHYYVKMANAWLISICYIKFPDITNKFLLNTKIDNWTFNKGIQKIRESSRISKEDKERLNKLKK